MAFTAGFSVNVGDPTKASDVDVLAANDDYLKNAIDTFIANDANNRVLTATGSGTANAESNLTFDGSTLTVTGTVSATTFSGNVTGGTISGSTGSFTSTISTSGGFVTVAGNPSAGSISSNGNGQIGGLTGNGLYMYGKGSTYDLALANANTTVALAIPTGGSATPDVYIPNSLGIGTSSPSALLHLKPSSSSAAIHTYTKALIETSSHSALQFSGSTGGEQWIWFADDSSSPPVGGITYYHGGAYMAFRVEGSERLRLDASGNMGLGVTPSAKIDIPIPSYDASTTNGMIRFTDPVNSSHANIQSYYVSGAGSGIVVGSNAYVNTSGTWSRWSTSYAGAAVHVRRTGDIKFLTNTSAGVVTERMALTSAGLLGLGTSSPSTLLHVTEGGEPPAEGMLILEANSSSRQLRIQPPTNADNGFFDSRGGSMLFMDDGAEIFRYGPTGISTSSGYKVGIGTTSPAAALHIDGTGGANNNTSQLRFSLDGTREGTFGVASGNGNIISGSTQGDTVIRNDGGNIHFSTDSGSSIAATIDSSGRVGINTTDTKNAMLYVEQDSASTAGGIQIGRYGGVAAWAISNVGSSLRFGIDNTGDGTVDIDAVTFDYQGRVGIGTNSPVVPLHLVTTSSSAASILDAQGSSNACYGQYQNDLDSYLQVGHWGSVRSDTFGGINLSNYAIVRAAGPTNGLIIGTHTPDPVVFATADAERARITSAGNFGIGSQSPTYKLVVSNGGAAGYEFNVNGLNGGVNTVVYNRSTSAYVDSAHFVDNYYIYSGQTPAERFRVESTGVCAFMTPNINIRFNGTATQSVLTNNNGVEIYTGGYIWAGRQAASLYLNRAGTTGDVAVFYYNSTTSVGSISVTSSATAYNTSSDYRLKENLAPITGAVDRVNALQPRRFNFISDPDTTVDGFVAHEVSSVVPEAITGEKDAVDEEGNPEYQGIDQSKLVPLLTAAIQELTARIEALEAA